ncbi:hypothetical protein [Rickettsia amblyommatis]|uniref:Uncharacterized protein n=2 Tax=Rickettsia amblyommatis TaxID=33989 RepID=H8K3W0_RICAG|nr:hypothetical protein [Rickettsia amblyommatis]AFC69204.1 hypothetical protein MCE_00920 [Rickettsia amblyommatis str. GAT-30V]KJV61431.1 hypothetical protein APHACPA_0438 [Rickettsia amblyommatis str. Ac/Pa]KJV97704.1 hypothetical protein RAMDARK_0210 [Rickettsia amblyommatis str. Darkwater]
MCASGKDREGLNEHNKISQSVSKYTGIKEQTSIDNYLKTIILLSKQVVFMQAVQQ